MDEWKALGHKKWKKKIFFKQTSKGLVDTEGKGEGGTNWESSMETYTHHMQNK